MADWDRAGLHTIRNGPIQGLLDLHHRLPCIQVLDILLVLIAVDSVSVFAADFSGQVVSVIDGDTIEVLHNNRAERIRLNGIDCPEKRQAYGKRAKQAASELVFGKDVTLNTFGKDKYRRTIADVLLSDGTNVNHELVKEGWCCWYQECMPGIPP